MKQRSSGVEDAWEHIHRECGFQVDRQVHVPAWDRFPCRCTGAGCPQRGLAQTPPAGPCAVCGAGVDSRREEAILDLDVRSPEVPRLLLDVTARHGVPGDEARLKSAADYDGAVNVEAERDKHTRFPAGRAPWRMLPLAVETYGRLGRTALLHLRKLARRRAQGLAEGGDSAVSCLVLRWGCRLSVALHRGNAANLQRSLGADVAVQARSLAATLAG